MLVQILVVSDGGLKPSFQKRAGDDQTLDFRGSLPNAVRADFPQETLSNVFTHVAATPKNLHGAIGDAEGRFRGKELSDGTAGMQRLQVIAPIMGSGGLVGYQ